MEIVRIIYGYASSVVFLWVTGCFGPLHYTPSPEAASCRVISPQLASQAQLVVDRIPSVLTTWRPSWGRFSSARATGCFFLRPLMPP